MALTPNDGLDYIIAPDDELDIEVIDVPEFTRDYRVSPDGTLTLPMLPAPVFAAGLTPDQLAAMIAERLRAAGLVTNASVTVSVKSSHAHSVAITGAVNNPQLYSIFGATTLLSVITQAGGLSPDASDTAVVTRGDTAMRVLGLQKDSASAKDASPASVVRVNLKGLFEGADPKANIPIFPGDSVTVLRAGIVYVVGAVNRAGGYTLARSWQNMTVLKAIALAGNVTPNAQRKKAEIIRRDPASPGGRREIPVNLKKILAGRAPDLTLEANDVLFVPESNGKKAFRQGMQAALGIGSGLLIYHAPL
ncbi:MAG TPA: SLBB domain-containing protein [Terriglobia bacterium]|nr:SLBB domain-containing protein [Terriglobia bacterium]